MLRIFQNNTLALLLIITSNVCLAIDKIELYSPKNKAFLTTYEFNAPFKESIDSYLELGDTIDAQIVKITATKNRNFKLSIQFETSLIIMDEGPHIDLTEWQHCITDWQDLQVINQNEFRLPEAAFIDESCFPTVSDAEIRTEVGRVGGERWLALLKGDLDVNQYPLGVALSAVRIRVQEEVNGTWDILTTINFIIPMGC